MTLEARRFAVIPSLFLVLCALLAPASSLAAERLWHVRAITPEGTLLEVKAFDKAGKGHDLKVIEEDGNLHFMDVKAIVDGKRLPVKILPGAEPLEPVKAIAEDGTILDVKAVGADGKKLDVKGVSHSGNIIHIKAIGPGNTFFGVKALSPDGQLHDIKGIKLGREKIEGKVNGVEFAAHVKALPQVYAAQH